MGTCIVSVILIAIVGFIIYRLFFSKKGGSCCGGCGGGCSGNSCCHPSDREESDKQENK